jgi:hypothetical protein
MSNEVETAMNVESPAVWERQPGESAFAFRAFTMYREMGPYRSQRKLCEALRMRGKQFAEDSSPADWKRPTSQKSGHVGLWSGKYRWVERTRAWDSHLAAISCQQQIEAVQLKAEQHVAGNRLRHSYASQ